MPSVLIKGVAAPVPLQLLCVHNYHGVAGFLGGRDGYVGEERLPLPMTLPVDKRADRGWSG